MYLLYKIVHLKQTWVILGLLMSLIKSSDLELDPTLLTDSKVTPKHPGTFFELQDFELRRLKHAGYRKIGVGIVLLNSQGKVLAAEHKGNYKLRDGMVGLTSETVGGKEENGQIVAEPLIQTIGRCINEELALDPNGFRATTKLDQHFTLSDWPVGANPELGKLLGINVALLLDDETAWNAARVYDTDEIYRAQFVGVEEILGGVFGENLRPGTLDCLTSLRDQGLLDVACLQEGRIEFPELVSPDFDIDLALARA